MESHSRKTHNYWYYCFFYIIVLLMNCPGKFAQAEFREWEALNQIEKNNRKCVDLTDIVGGLPLKPLATKQILRRTEKWEFSAWNEDGKDSLGFPSVVKNIYGPWPDNKYYLFYSHHDPNSGIGCAVSDKIDGPYIKIADLDKTRQDSQVLKPLSTWQKGKSLLRKLPYHFSSPCVLWDDEQQLWVMFFHYYKNEWNKGEGHQKTTVATCPDLRLNKWTIKTDEDQNIIPVFPTTTKRWMNSQSSYHSIQKMPDGKWLAFLRGTGGEYTPEGQWKQDTTKLGFAISSSSTGNWEYFPDNPIIHQENTGSKREGVLRPHFIGYLGASSFLVGWSESTYYDADLRIIYNITTDFRNFQRDTRGYAHWVPNDGLVSPWREDGNLYLFSGKYVHTFHLSLKDTRQDEK